MTEIRALFNYPLVGKMSQIYQTLFKVHFPKKVIIPFKLTNSKTKLIEEKKNKKCLARNRHNPDF